MKSIPESDVKWVGLSGGDKFGRLFYWDAKLLRAIEPEWENHTNLLFKSGLIDALVAEKIFPRSKVSELKLDGYGMIIEHQRIESITYPREWSFSMLKDAALTELRVNEIANGFGYETKDSQPCNVVFSGSRPMFVDLGSFVKIDPSRCAWRASEEFTRGYFYPLWLWAIGCSHIARRLMCGIETELIGHYEFAVIRYPIMRILCCNWSRWLMNKITTLKSLSTAPEGKLVRRCGAPLGAMIYRAAKAGLLPFQWPSVNKHRDKLARLDMGLGRSRWGRYQDEIQNMYQRGEVYPRYERILDFVVGLGIEHAIELAGNGGLFSRLLLRRGCVNRIVCTDYDEEAVDHAYISFCKDGLSERATCAILDLRAAVTVSCEESVIERLRCDGVILLAATHHLLLTQKIPIDDLLHMVGGFSNKYIVTEFMPLGLYDGGKLPELPSWYSEEWFMCSFRKHFELDHVEYLEENRVLFVGRHKQ